MEEKKKGIPGLVLGIISTLCGILCFVLTDWLCIPGLIVGIIGIVLSSKALKGDGKGIPATGLVLSIIGVILAIVVLVIWILTIAGLIGAAASAAA